MSAQVDVNALFLELVAKEMVACGETKHVERSLTDWCIECVLFKPGNKDRAKSGITRFLQEAWHASNIRFATRIGCKPGQFWVTFSSDEF